MRNRAENQVTLAWIRHGATKANEERRYLGKTDEPLSERGIKDLLSYQKKNKYPDVDCLFCSPMKRCVETAEILYPKLCPVVIPEWEEMDFGLFEYKNYQELKEDPRYQAWMDSGGTLPFPEGEGRESFLLRCEKGFARMCKKLRQTDKPGADGSARVGLIVHGGTIMALFSSHGGGNYFDYQVPNGRGYLCKMTGWGKNAVIWETGKI